MNVIENLKLDNPSLHERALTVTIGSDQVSKEFDKVLTKIQRVATHKGFRPGKMPKNLVMNFYEGKIKEELVTKLFEQSFGDACKNKELTPVSQPKLEPLSDIKNGSSFTYKAIFEVKPEVKLEKYEGLEVKTKNFTYNETDVLEEIGAMRESYATFLEAKPEQTITENDMVSCIGKLEIDGVIDEKHTNKDINVPLFDKNVPQNIKDALIGKKVNEVAITDYKDPNNEKDNENRKLHLHITSFKKRVLPKLDDEFAKDVSSDYETLEDLKESVRKRFDQTIERRNNYYLEDAICKELVNKNPIDVPKALVERMAMSLINQHLSRYSKDVAEKVAKEHWEKLWSSVQDQAQFKVKNELLFEALIKKLELSATNEEIEKAKKEVKEKDVDTETLEFSVLVGKLLDVLKEKAQITKEDEPLVKKAKEDAQQ